jgi:hypothetical protein
MVFRSLVVIAAFSLAHLAQASKLKLPVSLQVEPSALVQVGQKVKISAACSDTRGEDVIFHFAQGSLEGPKGTESTWERTFSAAGEFRITVNAQTSSGRTGHDAVSIVVRGENLPPKVRLSVDKPVASRGEPVTFTAHGEDPEKWSLRYQFARDGKILQEGHKHQFTETYSSLGEHALEVNAIDHEGASAHDHVKVVVVNQPPRLVVGGPSGGARHQPLLLEVTALDPDNDRVAIMYQDGEKSEWKPWQGQVQFSEPGPRTINFQGHDSHGGKSPITPYRVDIANASPTLELLPQNTTVARNQPLQIGIAVADPDRDRVAVTTKHPNVTITPETVSFTSDQLGIHSIDLTASDPHGGTITKTLDVEVINQSPNGKLTIPQNIGRNQPTMLTVEAADPDEDDLFYSFSINSGTWSEYLPSNSHLIEFSEPGTYPVAARVRDQHGGMVEFSDTVKVINAPPQITSLNLPDQIYRGQGVQLTVKASDPENDAVEYAYSVNGQPQINSPYPSFVFRAEDKNPVEVDVTVTDQWGGKASQVAHIAVANRNPRLVLSVAPPDRHGDISVRGWVEDPDGDPTEIRLTSSQGMILPQGSGRWILRTKYPQEVFIQATAQDTHGGKVTETLRMVTDRFSLTESTAITLSSSLFPRSEPSNLKIPQRFYDVLGAHFQTHSWRFKPPAGPSTVKIGYILKKRQYPPQKEIHYPWQSGRWQQYEVDPIPAENQPNPVWSPLPDHPLTPHAFKTPQTTLEDALFPGAWQKYR